MTAQDVDHAIQNGNYKFALARQCPSCGGTGWFQSSYSAVNPDGNYVAGSPAGSNTRCEQCTNGFQFRIIGPDEFLDFVFFHVRLRAAKDLTLIEWAVEQLKLYAEKAPNILRDMLVRATENVMAPETK